MSVLFLLSAFIILGSCLARQLDFTDWEKDALDTLKQNLALHPNTNVAKNIIFFIGDGMGVSTVTAARIHKGQLMGKLGEEHSLTWDEFKDVALVKTYNTDQQTADSAGTATAYHCGVKSKAGVIGVTDRIMKGNCSTLEEGSAGISSIREWAAASGKSVGIVTTARVTHASPAPLYARSPDRDWESATADVPWQNCSDIALQLIENGLDISVILGGGRRNFLKEDEQDPEYPLENGTRVDGRNLIKEWEAKQGKLNRRFRVVNNKEEFDAASASDVDYLLGLFEPSHMQFEYDRNATGKHEPSLEEMVTKAIEILNKNPKGYFLFVEGGRIDHGHHQNQALHALSDAVAMDTAVAKAKAMTSQDDTLLVVSADHSHVFTIGGYAKRGTDILGQVVPSNLKYKSGFGSDSKPLTIILYGNGPGYETPREDVTGRDIAGNSTYKYQTAVPLESESHGGEDVALYASGPMSHLFRGTFEQSYIPHVMAYAACMGTAEGDHCKKAGLTKPVVTDCPCSVAAGSKAKGLGVALTVLISCLYIFGPI